MMNDLDHREQALVRLAATVATSPERVAGAVRSALDAGATAAEVRGALVTLGTIEGVAPASEQTWEDLAACELSPWSERFEITVGEVTTVVAHRAGTGIPLVLCHSLGTDHTMWEPVVEALPHDVEVWAWDARNHGAHRETSLDFSVPLVAEDAARLFDELGIDQALLAGISMGGALVQEFAIGHQERLAGLAIMATRGKGGPSGEQRALAAEREGLAAQVEETLSRWFSPGFLAVNDGRVRHVRRLLLSWSVESWAKGWRALGATSTASRLHTVEVPTLCVAGEADRSAPPAVLQALVDVLPKARLVVVPRGSHLFPLEEPMAAAQVLLEHRASLPA